MIPQTWLARTIPRLAIVTAALVGCSDAAAPSSAAPLAGGACRPSSTPSPADVVVSIDPGRRLQTMQGFGTTERLFDDPHLTNTFDATTLRGAVVIPAAAQAQILDALYVELGLTRVRYNPRDTGTNVGLEPFNDNADPNVTDLTKFDFAWKKNDGHIDFVRAVLPRGVTTYYASPLTLETWMTESSPAEYVEWAMAVLRRWRAAGLEMPYYSIVNEPGNTAMHNWSGAFLRDVTKLLGAKLASEGFRTKLVVPDDINATQALPRLQTILADPQARQYVGAIAYHLYGGNPSDRDRVKQLAEQYGLPVWMSEYSQADWLGWARTMHDMLANYDAAAIDYMWGFFGQWDARPAQLLVIRTTGNTYSGFDRRKQFYAMGQYSRFVRPGAVRVAATTSDPATLVTAFVNGPALTVVAINTGPTDRSVRLDLTPANLCVTSVAAVRTSATDDGATLPAPSTDGVHVTTSLRGTSITTITMR